MAWKAKGKERRDYNGSPEHVHAFFQYWPIWGMRVEMTRVICRYLIII